MGKTMEQIQTEMEAAQAALESLGREIGQAGAVPSDEGKIKCDFELPYSSLPKLRAKRWIQTEKNV